MPATDARTELIQAYREASGIAYSDQRQQAIEQLQLAPFYRRAFHNLTDIGPDFAEERKQKESGMRWLNSLISQTTGTYPRSAITYKIHGGLQSGKQNFAYNLTFLGETIDLEGQVALPQRPNPLWLKVGRTSIVEIARNRERILHVPQGEGIAIVADLDRSVPWAQWGNRTAIATWYPELTDKPQAFYSPNEGRTLWKAQS